MRRRSSLTAEKDNDPELKQRPGRAAAHPATRGRQGPGEEPGMGKRPFRSLGGTSEDKETISGKTGQTGSSETVELVGLEGQTGDTVGHSETLWDMFLSLDVDTERAQTKDAVLS
ncbi:hypothetical protein CCH79_00020600 [Gambusia affinis]|uniref:Uncharacterized protein n=1 Tax=Gambusia affinis TaxID=33528 RepID=A0A315VR33_GAMAF|nr:hypothetical protein CCH79_00020600 [Gambusia affinis]